MNHTSDCGREIRLQNDCNGSRFAVELLRTKGRERFEGGPWWLLLSNGVETGRRQGLEIAFSPQKAEISGARSLRGSITNGHFCGKKVNCPRPSLRLCRKKTFPLAGKNALRRFPTACETWIVFSAGVEPHLFSCADVARYFNGLAALCARCILEIARQKIFCRPVYPHPLHLPHNALTVLTGSLGRTGHQARTAAPGWRHDGCAAGHFHPSPGPRLRIIRRECGPCSRGKNAGGRMVSRRNK